MRIAAALPLPPAEIGERGLRVPNLRFRGGLDEVLSCDHFQSSDKGNPVAGSLLNIIKRS